MKLSLTKTFFTLITALFCFCANAQIANSGRGMYVNRFFRTAVNSIGAPIVDPNYSILSIAAKEDSLLQFAKDNHITYLILYDLYYVFGNETYENYLCSFIDKAKSQFCIEKIGVASSCASLFDNIEMINATPPASFSLQRHVEPAFRQQLAIASEEFQPGDSLFYLSEATKFNLRASTFNSGCNSKIDALVTEYEFWNSTADDCVGDTPSKDVKFQRYQSLINYIDIIRDNYNDAQSTHQITVESYIGYLNQNTLYTDQQIADWIDGSYNGKKRIDRILPHYYTTDAAKAYSRTSAGQNMSGYYSTRFLDLCQPSTSNNTSISPIFSTESTYWGAGASYLSTWFNQSPANNLFTAEKIFYNDWYADANTYSPALVGSATLGNEIEPGNAIWFTSNQMLNHLNRSLLFSSNSPVCVTAGQNGSFTFQYQGPIEQGLNYQFYLTTSGTTTVVCGSANSIAWPAYNGSTQSSIDLNAALGTCSLPSGDYDAHLVLTFSACNIYVAPIQKVSITNTGKIVARTATTACQGNPVYLTASTTGSGTTTYAWYDGNTAISGATSQSYVANPASTGVRNYSCKITSSVGGCSANRSNIIPVTINANPVATITVQSTSSCSSVIRANPSGATYSWQDGTTTQNYTASNSGVYSVGVTQNGCTSTAKYSYQNVSVQNISQTKSCSDTNTGSLVVNLYWGTFPYSLSWSGPVSGNQTNLQPGHTTISNLPAGTYTVVVTSSNGCTKTLFPNPVIEEYPQITYTTNVSPSTCSASSDGMIYLTNVAGGIGGTYTFNWPFNNSTLNSINNIHSGNYYVDISDGTCVVSDTIHVPAMQSTVNVALGINPSTGNLICAGTNASFNAVPVNGGLNPSYQWKVNGNITGVTDSTFNTDLLEDGDTVSCTMIADQVCASSNPVSASTTMLVDICPVTVNLNLFLEGFYLGASQMRAVIDPVIYPNLCDTITIELRDTTGAKNLIHTSKQILNTDGTCVYSFIPLTTRSFYYIVIKHRNSLETWSATPVFFSGISVEYSFSNSATNVFLNNVSDLGDGNFGIISGDVDQNGVIDLNDHNSVNNSAMIFQTGYYSDDLNGDGLVESGDFSIGENNIGRIVGMP